MTKLNPFIQKLAEEAKGFVDLNQHVGGDNGCMIYTYQGLNKFAELIVQECLGIVDNAERGGSNEIWDNAVKFIRRDVQEHFGVK